MNHTLESLLAPVVIVAGHSGVGKTNFALNLAIDSARQGIKTTLVDLDVENPYFRSTEYRPLLEDAGVALVAPVFSEAGTSLDVPSLTGAIEAAILRAYREAGTSDAQCGQELSRTHSYNNSLHLTRITIIDSGGDADGARILGRYAKTIQSGPYAFLYVINAYRTHTQTPTSALDLLAAIERAARLHATGLVNNSHLVNETNASTIICGMDFAEAASALSGLPLVCTTFPAKDASVFAPLIEARGGGAFPLVRYVRLPWDE